jgi:Fic family protein
MDRAYEPPFEMTGECTNLVIEIATLVGSITTRHLPFSPQLRRLNRIRAIHSSLAIEQNTLTLEQVTDVIDGRRVLAPPQGIKEVKNAYELYEQMDAFKPFSIEDLLSAHRIMMLDFIKDAGRFRSQEAGVYSGRKLIHAGSLSHFVPELIAQLFSWLRTSKMHPLIRSCVFHYEFEFIHPFTDGNGRTGRFWHSLILSKWQPLFAWLPIESLVHDRQEAYYEALDVSNRAGQCTRFVEFMLAIIRDSLLEAKVSVSNVTDKVTDKMTDIEGLRWRHIKSYLQQHGSMQNADAQSTLKVSDATAKRLLHKLADLGLLQAQGERKARSYSLPKKSDKGDF